MCYFSIEIFLTIPGGYLRTRSVGNVITFLFIYFFLNNFLNFLLTLQPSLLEIYIYFILLRNQTDLWNFLIFSCLHAIVDKSSSRSFFWIQKHFLTKGENFLHLSPFSAIYLKLLLWLIIFLGVLTKEDFIHANSQWINIRRKTILLPIFYFRGHSCCCPCLGTIFLTLWLWNSKVD